MHGPADTDRSIPEKRTEFQDFLLLQRVAQSIGSILDLDTLLERIVDDVAQTFGY